MLTLPRLLPGRRPVRGSVGARPDRLPALAPPSHVVGVRQHVGVQFPGGGAPRDLRPSRQMSLRDPGRGRVRPGGHAVGGSASEGRLAAAGTEGPQTPGAAARGGGRAARHTHPRPGLHATRR